MTHSDKDGEARSSSLRQLLVLVRDNGSKRRTILALGVTEARAELEGFAGRNHYAL